MADKIIKCANYNQCKQEWNFIPIKGPNNTELCHKCGGDICFICNKKWQKEENFSWVEDYDCRGNKIMAKSYRSMFRQNEKDENHLEGDLTVYYCDEHQAEGEKSPNKWTKADQEQLKKKEEQEKLEREEKLNSQKDLFYCQDPHDRAVEWKQIEGIEYGCIYFQGRENGQNFNLLVPDTHPDLVSFKYKEKVKDSNGVERECACWTLKKQFYLIEGVDALPLEASDIPNDFYKVVGLSDRITIAPFEKDKEPENQNEEGECDTCHKILKAGREGIYIGNYHGRKSNRLHVCHNCYQDKEQEYLQNYAFVYSYSPVRYQKNGSGYIKNDNMYCYADKKGLDGEILKQKDCPHCWPWKNPKNSDELDANFLLQYFSTKNLKSIKLEGEMLTVECEWKTGSSTITYSLQNLLINYPELQGIDKFLQNRHDKKITRQELAGNNNSDTTENPPGNENKVLLWLGLSGVSLIIVGIITWLVLRKKKVRKVAN